ncbi:MAG: class I SAM-dependent methyltransferase, partial [Methyloligellaceae bacterium]
MTAAGPDIAAEATARGAPMVCPVCRAPSPRQFLSIDGRDYWQCEVCEARFLDPHQQPGPQAERDHYLLHENDPGDPRYRKFLSKLAEPLLEKLGAGMCGLDYGCGPGPALAAMLREAGQCMSLYDPFFHPDLQRLSQTYDFIVCTETAEHFHRPADEFDRLDTMLRPGGWLGVMTCFQTDDALFADWHYRKDPTHVVFYRETSLRMIA